MKREWLYKDKKEVAKRSSVWCPVRRDRRDCRIKCKKSNLYTGIIWVPLSPYLSADLPDDQNWYHTQYKIVCKIIMCETTFTLLVVSCTFLPCWVVFTTREGVIRDVQYTPLGYIYNSIFPSRHLVFWWEFGTTAPTPWWGITLWMDQGVRLTSQSLPVQVHQLPCQPSPTILYNKNKMAVQHTGLRIWPI